MRSRRNTFARETYIPVVVARAGQHGPASTCSWCGQSATPRHPIYDVMIEPDAGRRAGISGHFCSWQCAESYSGAEIGR